MQRLQIENLGPIRKADVKFGDLTVLVGPQASGKSVFLQTFKLLVDTGAIHGTLSESGVDWKSRPEAFFDVYYGEGMGSLWTKKSRCAVDGEGSPLPDFTKKRKRSLKERVFFIPAQRVVSFRDGLTRPFADFRFGDPFVLRDFSAKVHDLVQSEFGSAPRLFPIKNRLKAALRDSIATNVFGGASLNVASEKYEKRLVLQPEGSGTELSFLVWSAGQREFVPFLLGLYWLMPPSRVAMKQEIEWVVIEEPEMGLHPDAISTTVALVLELLHRGYKVCLSTHSPHVLDVVWAIRFIQAHGGSQKDVRDIFNLGAGATGLAESVLEKELRTYFFSREGVVADISSLDPGAEDSKVAGWGGLTGFSGHVGDIVAEVARREEGSEA